MKSIIIIAVVLLGCVALNQALKCYTHGPCAANCPQLETTIQECTGDDNKCYKAAFAVGVSRGCAREQCNVQANAASMLANVCCETNLCNSGVTPKITFSAFFMVMIAFFWGRM